MNPSVEGSGVKAMRKLQAVPCATLLLFFMVAQAQAQSVQTHHTRPAVTSGQAKFLNRLPETQTCVLTLFCRCTTRQAWINSWRSFTILQPSYRHFLTVPEFTARFGPAQEEYEAFLVSQNLTALRCWAAPAMPWTCNLKAR